MNDNKAYMNFSYEDVNGKTTSISVSLDWDCSWVEIINHIAMAMEGAGFIDARKGIQVKNFDHFFDKEEPEFIPLTEAMENR